MTEQIPMEPVAQTSGTGRRPIDFLERDARRALLVSRKAFRRAAALRGRIAANEEKLRDWERRVVAKGFSARRWPGLLSEGLSLLADSGSLGFDVRHTEAKAIGELRNGLTAARTAAAREPVPPLQRAIRLLEMSEELRAMELQWLDTVLAQTHSILNLKEGAALDQVLARLEQRRTVGAMLDTHREEAEAFETRALELLTGVKRKDKGESPPRLERRMARRTKKTQPPEPAPAVATEAEVPSGENVLAPLDSLVQAIQQASQQVSAARADVEGRIAAFVEKLEVEHAAALEEESRRRAEVEEQLADLREERKAFEERVLAAEKAAEELREELEKSEEAIAEERERLATDRATMQARVVQAERERDEALVLVTSLTRRLNTPGLDGAGEE